MGRLAGRALLGLALLAAAVYAGDWLVWRIRTARGGGMGSVTVSRMQVASLKGNKEEYYYLGAEDVPCSRSLFPQTGEGACWWVMRHRVVLER